VRPRGPAGVVDIAGCFSCPRLRSAHRTDRLLMQRVRAWKPPALPRRRHRHALRLVHPLPLTSGAAVGTPPGRGARALRDRCGGWSRLQQSTVRRYTTLSTCGAQAWCLRLLGVRLAAPAGAALPGEEASPLGGQSTASAARACCLPSRRIHCFRPNRPRDSAMRRRAVPLGHTAHVHRAAGHLLPCSRGGAQPRRAPTLRLGMVS